MSIARTLVLPPSAAIGARVIFEATSCLRSVHWGSLTVEANTAILPLFGRGTERQADNLNVGERFFTLDEVDNIQIDIARDSGYR